MYHVYAISNAKHKVIYIGQTHDIKNRLNEHNSASFEGTFTSRFKGTWALIYSEGCPSRNAALKREKQLKSYRGREAIKKFIPG
jgi:putative endonuclease